MSNAPTGRRESRDGTDYIVLTRPYAGPIEELWDLVTDPEQMKQWIGTWTGDPDSGEVEFFMTAEGQDVGGQPYRIDACERPRHLAVHSVSEDEDDSWRFVIDLDDDDGFTTLTFAQAVDDPDVSASGGPGWEYYLDRLSAVHRGDDLDHIVFDTYLADQQEYYRGLFL